MKIGRLRAKRKKASRRLGPQFFWMREVRVLRSDGRQTAIITTRQDLAAVEVAYRQFNRWRQENYFKYMSAEFALDGLLAMTRLKAKIRLGTVLQVSSGAGPSFVLIVLFALPYGGLWPAVDTLAGLRTDRVQGLLE